jgi:uncharacterized protein (DUF2235 family)
VEADPVLDAKRRADAPAPLASPKRIIAFSDGTGNSSSNLFRTNVWRLYDALDLGDSSKLSKVAKAGNAATGQAPGQTDTVAAIITQIAYYDNGVGTSSVRFLAVLGGIFGFGLKRNLLDLYKYVCRNCSDALRRFLSANAPDNFPWLFQSVRWVRDVAITGWRKFRGQRCDTPAAAWPDIEFVGVWDTVSAYGGPIIELTRGIDQYVWPLSMTNYALHPKVKVARHALALDDERDSFWPLLWDELAEDYGARGQTPQASVVHGHAFRCWRRLSGRQSGLRFTAMDD